MAGGGYDCAVTRRDLGAGGRGTATARRHPVLLALSVVLVATNLRPAVGPPVRHRTGAGRGDGGTRGGRSRARPRRAAGAVRRHGRRGRGDRDRQRPAAPADQAGLPRPQRPDDGCLHDGRERGRRRGGWGRGAAGRRVGPGLAGLARRLGGACGGRGRGVVAADVGSHAPTTRCWAGCRRCTATSAPHLPSPGFCCCSPGWDRATRGRR